MGNSFEYIIYNCVLFQLLSGTRGERRPFFPFSFKREAKGAEVTFHHSIIGNFMVNKI